MRMYVAPAHPATLWGISTRTTTGWVVCLVVVLSFVMQPFVSDTKLLPSMADQLSLSTHQHSHEFASTSGKLSVPAPLPNRPTIAGLRMPRVKLALKQSRRALVISRIIRPLARYWLVFLLPSFDHSKYKG